MGYNAAGDSAQTLIEALQGARAEGQSVAISGMGSKSFLTRAPDVPGDERLLSTLEHTGIVDYHPDELVVTVRCGTPLKELKQALARESQMLAFEPPEFQGLGTIGGAVASGLAGPGRPWRGGVRDSLLGVVMVNGLGERLNFGGQVMKNVAGFDVSRLQAGAFGIFGLLLEVSLRVVPIPALEQTQVLEMEPATALALMRTWSAAPMPITATAFDAGRLYARLSGSEPAVMTCARQVGGERQSGAGYWSDLKDHAGSFFKGQSVGCRHVAPASPVVATDELIEWSGGRRWSRLSDSTGSEETVPFGEGYARRICQEAGGDSLLAGYQRRLKVAFDPDNLLNPEICDADVTT